MPIAVIRLDKKRDTILHSYVNPLNDTVGFKKRNKFYSKKVFWTIEGLFPIFFAELHFPFDEPYNYYEIHTILPRECLEATEGKIWVSGKAVISILSKTHIVDDGQVFEMSD